MAKILVSGLINVETSVKIKEFPINYFPIDYKSFGIESNVSGVGFNLCRAYATLGDEVRFISMTGTDATARTIREALAANNISDKYIKPILKGTPVSVVLYDESGRRQIHNDLKDIQENNYDFSDDVLEDIDVVCACNINFNRPLLSIAKKQGKIVATDVHVLSNIDDEYNREFMDAADILFLSDEAIACDYREFLKAIHQRYNSKLIVLGMGKNGALLFNGEDHSFTELPAHSIGEVKNTVGAGDALFSSFIHYYAKGLAPAEALDRAQLFAAMKIQHSGGAEGFPNERELDEKFTEIKA